MRTRTKHKAARRGTYRFEHPYTGSVTSNISYGPSQDERIDDVLHPYPYVDDGPLWVDKRTGLGTRLDGQYTVHQRWTLDPKDRVHTFTDYPIGRKYSSGGSVARPSLSYLYTLALTNYQQTPGPNVLNSVVELKDIARSLRQLQNWGRAIPQAYRNIKLRKLLRDVVNTNITNAPRSFFNRFDISGSLNDFYRPIDHWWAPDIQKARRLTDFSWRKEAAIYRKYVNYLDKHSRTWRTLKLEDEFLGLTMGIIPTIVDVLDIIDNQQDLEKSLSNLKRSSKSGGGKLYSRKDHYYSGWQNEWMNNMVIKHRVRHEDDVSSWYSYKAMPMQAPTPYDQALTTLGIGRLGSVTWNAIPFSFLIDYFFNVSDYISHTEGVSTAQIYSLCLMRKTVSDQTVELKIRPEYGHRLVSDGLTINSSALHYSQKIRQVHTELADAKFALKPLLSGRQIANVTALAVALMGRR